MAACGLNHFLYLAWPKNKVSSEEAVQPKPNSSSDQSGFIWMERLSKVQIFIVLRNLNITMMVVLRLQETRCSRFSPSSAFSLTGWSDSHCPNLSPLALMAMQQTVLRLSKPILSSTQFWGLFILWSKYQGSYIQRYHLLLLIAIVHEHCQNVCNKISIGQNRSKIGLNTDVPPNDHGDQFYHLFCAINHMSTQCQCHKISSGQKCVHIRLSKYRVDTQRSRWSVVYTRNSTICSVAINHARAHNVTNVALSHTIAMSFTCQCQSAVFKCYIKYLQS